MNRWSRLFTRRQRLMDKNPSFGFQRIEELQPGKTGEIAVGGGEGGAMLDGQGGQVRVGNQGSPGLPFDHHRA